MRYTCSGRVYETRIHRNRNTERSDHRSFELNAADALARPSEYADEDEG